jgi:hypothetical protein
MDFEINSIPRLKQKDITKINQNHNFSVFDWDDYISTEKYKRDYKYKTFRTVFPRWDNSPRKAYTGAFVFDGTTPENYGKWLKYVINKTQDELINDERIVFINAWNEWVEGSYLLPDKKYGYAYLEAVKEVMAKK